MDDSSASTSADPLTLPSSPLVRHNSPRKANTRPLRSHSPSKQQFSSPSKSFIMDTGDGGNDQSPWRIKVTVQAEPRNGTSPSKGMSKTTTVPLKGGSSSPAKRPARRRKAAAVKESEMEVEIKRPQRKRKGTPIRRAPMRPTPGKVAEVEEAELASEDMQGSAIFSSPRKKQAKRKGRKSFDTMPTQRGQRLSQAREELDEALQDAVGQGAGEYEEDSQDFQSEAMQGDMTAMNEDFTMISVETLQSMKQNTSMLEDSQVGDKSAMNGSYWPSSPPGSQQSAKRSAGKQTSASRVDYPNISAEAQYARETLAKSFVHAFDAMSWKPTGRAAQEPTPADSSELQHSSGRKTASTSEARQWRKEREGVSQQIESAPEQDIVVIEDEPQAGLGAEASGNEPDEPEGAGGEDDIWAEEASRSLEEDVEVSHVSHRSRQAPQHGKSQTVENLNDLFSGLSSKPPRAKIPRTWRRSSGIDFTYSDSPAHSFAQDVPEETPNAAGSGGSEGDDDEAERGSGVLTPPSTDEDEDANEGVPDAQDGDAQEKDLQDAEDADAEVLDGGASRSIFEPDAAATELQVHRHETTADSDSDDHSSAGGDDTGLFWRSRQPNAHKLPARRQVPQKRKAQDLSSLLGETESSQIESQVSTQSAHPAQQGDSREEPARPAKRFPGSNRLAARREAASSSFTSTSSGEQPPEKRVAGASVLAARREAATSSMLSTSSVEQSEGRRQPIQSQTGSSLAKQSHLKNRRVAAAGTVAEEAEPAVASANRRQQLAVPIKDRVDESGGNTSMSFASKASDQRQLLEEISATPKVQPRRKVASHVAIKPAVEESLWHAAAEDEELQDEAEEASSPAQSVDYSAASEAQYTDDYVSEDEDDEEMEDVDSEADLEEPLADTTRSYEERLNLSSPQKIRVNFGDSSTVGNSSLLQPRKAYPPLFTEQPPPSRGRQHQRPAANSHTQSSEPGIFSRLSSTIWSALVRPSAVPAIEPVFPASLRTQLRSRYGVLSNQHPWTMAHMRTLHRMMNSCSTGKKDSIIPKPRAQGGTLDLPSSLLPFAGRKVKDVIGREFVVTEQLAHVVWALMQTLVPATLIEQMEAGDIDFIGDSMAFACRGYFDSFNGKPRHGGDVVFSDAEVLKSKPRPGEMIGVDWVVRSLGACVHAQRVADERDARIDQERRAWEGRNGLDVGDESEVLQKVREA